MTTDHLWQKINQNNAICPGVDDEEEEPSDDIKDMSSQSSAEICTGAKGKYQLLILLAKALVKAGHIAIESSDINYRNLKRTEVNVITDIESLISDGEQSQDSCSSNDVVNDSQMS